MTIAQKCLVTSIKAQDRNHEEKSPQSTSSESTIKKKKVKQPWLSMRTILSADGLLLSGLPVYEFYSFQQYSAEKRL